MIVQAPGVLALLLAAGELLAGAALLVAALRALRRRPFDAAAEAAAEPMRPLVLLLVLLVAGLSAASLLAWGILLQGLVPQWADVRCVVGVLRVGTGARGAASWLPLLADATTGLRAALVVAAGACALLHLAARDRTEGRLARGHLLLLALTGLLAVGAALAEGAWIVLPKGASDLSAGCCTQFTPESVHAIGDAPAAGDAARVAWAYGLCALGGAAAEILAARPAGSFRWTVLARDLWAIFVPLLGFRFVEEVVAPARLGLPLHRCLWCLFGEAPETVVGLALLAAPLLAAVWRVALLRLGPDASPTTGRILRALDGVAILGYLGGLAFFVSQYLSA